MRNKRKKKTRIKKEIVVLSVILIILVIAIALYLSMDGSREKKPAEEYFRVFNTTINDAEPRTNDTVIMRWIIYGISFEIEAVGGDAHNVIVLSWAKAYPIDVGDIPKGESRYVSMTSSRPYGYNSIIDEEGKVPMTIRVTSTEAKGAITIYF